jgi:hypothetical protein
MKNMKKQMAHPTDITMHNLLRMQVVDPRTNLQQLMGERQS